VTFFAASLELSAHNLAHNWSTESRAQIIRGAQMTSELDFDRTGSGLWWISADLVWVRPV